MGVEVATLVAENLSAGGQTVDWDVDGLAGGVYFYRLQMDDLIQTKKLILLK
jgi:hypothetical protein